MSISGISANTNTYQAYQTSGQNKFAQFRQDFQDLASALQSGNLSGAQQAFATLQQLLPNSSAGKQTQNGQQGSNPNLFATDLNAVGQALQSGDLSGAQKAFATLQPGAQSVQGHHHHHHHDRSASTQSTTGIQTQNGQQGSGQSQFSSDLNAVGQALQSGDLSQAQAPFAKLQQDMQSVQGHHHYHHHNASASAQSTTPTTASPSVGSSINVSA